MCGGILLGTLVAVTHHFFYQSLNGQIVHSDNQQQWFLRIGTGLAFLAKTFLTASAALGYTQLLWLTLRSSPISLHGVDSLFGAVTNAWHFTDWELWRRGPALAIVALIVWTIPLIAIVTPATLTVHPAAKSNQSVHHLPIPSIDYGIIQDQTFALTTCQSGIYAYYDGPAPRIRRLMSSVTSQGSILQIVAPYPNCTYLVPFYGPSISCGLTTTGNSSFQEEIADLDINLTLSDAALVGLKGILINPYSKLLSNYNSTTIDQVSTDHARLYATTSRPSGGLISASGYETIECGLYNASYVVNFTFSNGQQDVIVKNMTQLNGPILTSICLYVGKTMQEGPCTAPGMAYTSILDALGNILIVYLAGYEYGSLGAIYPQGTQIMGTVLMESIELQGNLGASKGTNGLVEQLSIANMTLSEALEQIVLNATLSLFSDSYFLQNSTTASILPVLVSTPQNAYVYNSENLFIAYGLGILISAIVVIVGIACIWASGNSFGASFSAILRTTRNAQLDTIVPAKETQGTFPLSKELGKTKLILRRQREMRTAFAVVDEDEGDGEEMETTKPSSSRRMSFDSLLQRT
ncbi:hypothetical protein L207DRAFT_587331 [Hyaloscypha variabilis F]|uniref:Transmembrane protein n=1 Tax=Hyaloscypha variabilis (strain UAMH 11265 / GT02V1 / F) TaxID=1149755 RepID=A0A2J6RCT5_HYAVF|nr:hypothetical protein L207DRAFT_587331 [Hyaloscypha variabilis F]